MTRPGSGGCAQDRCQSSLRTSGTVSGSRSKAKSSAASPPTRHFADHGQVRMRQHGKRDVAVPPGPASDLVLIEADLALGGLKAGLDGPAPAGHPHQLGQAGACGCKRQVEGERIRLGDLAPDQEALLPAGGGVGPVGQIGPIVQPRAFGALTGAQPPPRLGRSSSQSATGLRPSRCALVTVST
jgi:hypothetical protein